MAAGQRQLGGEPQALAVQRILRHLHRQALAFAPRYVRRFAFGAAWERQEPGARRADVHEGRLHAWRDAGDRAEMDVADLAAGVAALHVQLHEVAVLDERDARLERVYVDEQFFGHDAALRQRHVSMPKARSISSVSAKGRPTTAL